MNNAFSVSTLRTEPLISPAALSKELPATITQTGFVEQSREQIIHILAKKDPRLLLILGPCSIHDPKAALHYAVKLKELSKEISDVFFPVMRFHFEKPRTVLGWTGMMHDPHLDRSFDLNTGVRATRNLLVQLAALEIPAAAEILDPLSAFYFGELLSWACIGARTSSSQLHRQAASGLSIPVGFKNTTDGNIENAVNGILAASESHAYIGINREGMASIIYTQGNPHCHLVLRGGEGGPNYDAESVRAALEKLKRVQSNPSLLIDCSHDNSGRDHTRQPQVFESVMNQVFSGNTSIRGLLLESHLCAGSQPIASQPELLKYAVSLTDSCIDWKTTEDLILSARDLYLIHAV